MSIDDITTPQRSPLEEIESAVQRQASAVGLDADTAEGRLQLRRLIDTAVREWSEDHRRGIRQHAIADPDAVATRAYRNLAEYGPLTELLIDDDIWEICINDPSSIFVRRHSSGSRYHPRSSTTTTT